MSEQLKPLRDFFLMFFFFVLGASFDFGHLGAVWAPALVGAALIAVTALSNGRPSAGVAHLVQLTTVATMLISSYLVVMRYPTPIGTRANLQSD